MQNANCSSRQTVLIALSAIPCPAMAVSTAGQSDEAPTTCLRAPLLIEDQGGFVVGGAITDYAGAAPPPQSSGPPTTPPAPVPVNKSLAQIVKANHRQQRTTHGRNGQCERRASELAERGLSEMTHRMMLDKNNSQIADITLGWPKDNARRGGRHR
jgi:hypothetical protein